MPQKPAAKKARKNKFAVRQGAVPASSQVTLFNEDDWEEFVLEAARQRQKSGSPVYDVVKRLGGAGDGGRDVEARYGADLVTDGWDLYQCKHYASGLMPSEVFPEMAKFFKHLAAKTYPKPSIYYLCAPHGVGNDLHNLLAASGEAFKAAFVTSWEKGTSGMKGRLNELIPVVREVIDDFDFKRFRECTVRDLLHWHARNQRAHFELFGIVPVRGVDDRAPAAPAKHEDIYIDELVRVYSEDHGSTLSRASCMTGQYAENFESHRQSFYCAEGLLRFSRDLYTDPEFEKLLEMVLDGLRPFVTRPKLKTGMERLDVAIEKVTDLQLQESRLHPQIRAGDLPGTCHHLVNHKRLKWVK
ncbi:MULTISPECIES: ABC-three component system protein [Achromobacter]|uniref:ABC-three component system protein n=1 Tax=Achromobacter TaxID=222 RepID=UPI0025BA7FF0|nr:MULTISPECIES: ABC-three component system protein [Achromobacter]